LKSITAVKTALRLALLLFLCSFGTISLAQVSADFTASVSGGCSPLAVSFTNLSTLGPNIRYSWDFGNGNTSVLRNPSAIYIDEKTYTITLTVTDGTQTATRTRTITVYKKPVANFTTPKPYVCLPESVQFTSTSTPGDGSINSYKWTFGDGTVQDAFGSTTSYFYQSPIVPTVSLTVTNNFGCKATVTKSNIVEVLPRIEPLFTVNKTLLCTLADSVVFTNNSTGPGTLSYNWDFGDGNRSTLKNPVHRYATKGLFQVRLTVTNEFGCSVTSSSTTINAAHFQTNFTNQNLCRQVTFTGSSFLYPTSSVWQFGNGGTSTSYSLTNYTYAAAGSYEVTLINTYNNICKDTIKKTITVQDNVNYNSNITAPPSVCRGNMVNITATSTAIPSARSWNMGDGTIYNFNSGSVNHIYNTPGTYTITLVNTFGTCSETVTKTIVVNDLPSTNSFVVDFGGVCGAPVTGTFRDTSTGNVSWQWAMNWSTNTPFSTAQNATYNFTTDGTYWVYLTVTNAAGCTKQVQRSVRVSSPSANITVLQSSSPKSHYDCDSLELRLGVNSTHTIAQYNWNFGNGVTSTSATPTIKYTTIGVYNIRLDYVTDLGCTGSAFFSARVYDKPKANFTHFIPCGNTVTLNFTDTSPFSDTWTWFFGDGGAAYWNVPSHTYADTGLYTVTFINKIGRCSDTIRKVVHANVLPSGIQITRAENTCVGTRGTVLFDQRSLRCSGGTWNFGDGTIIPFDSSRHNFTHTYANTGTYNVTLTSSYNGCTYTVSRTVNVLLKQNPTLTANQTQICVNNNLGVQIGNLQTNPFSPFSWSQYFVQAFQDNNGNTINAFLSGTGFQNTSYSGSLQNLPAGITGIRAIVQAGNTNCFDTTNYVSVQVNGPIVGFRVNNENACYKTPFVFTDTSRSSTNVALTTWRWEMGDGNVFTNTTNAPVTHRYINPNSYNVRLTVTDATGCSKTYNRIVNARGPRASFTASGLFVPNVPLNTSVSFFNNTSSFSNTVNFVWHYGDGATSTSYTGSHTYTVPGVYEVLLIATDPAYACSDTARQTITVKDFNTAFRFTKSFVGSGSCPPVQIRINNLSVGYTRLLWDFGDGNTSTQSFPSHTYNNPGLYRITLSTFGFNGLTGTYIDSVLVTRPSATITADTLKGCLSQQVQFGLTQKDATSYLWDFGDGTASTSATAPVHTYLSPGIYNPRLIVKDTSGCQVSARLQDSVVIDELSATIKGIPSLICDSALINFVADVKSFSESKLGTQLKFKWDFGTGNAADTSNLRNPSFRYVQPGSYTVRLRVTSQYGCVKDTFATFRVQQKAKASITGNRESCEQTTVQFSGAATPAGGVQWNWNFANGNTSTDQNPTAQLYNTPGTYGITLIVTKNGCIDTAFHQLTVYGKPVVNALPRQQVVCFGDSVRLWAQGGGTYQWTPAMGLSNATIAAPMATPTTSTLYRVRVTSDKGCVNSDSINLTVAQPIDVSVASGTSLCRGFDMQLAANGATSYQWINNVAGLSNTNISDPVARPTVTTTYTVVGSDQYNCFKDTALVTINLHDIPTVSAGPDVQIQGGTPYQLTATASADVVSWLWSPATTLSCADCPTPMAAPKMETAYTIKVANQWGCVAMDTIVVRLQCTQSKIYIPDAFTPNGDGKNDVFYISGSGIKAIHYFRIFDRWGGVLFEKRNPGIDDRSSGWNGRVNGQLVAPGTYVYVAEMECSSGDRFVRKGTITVVH